MKGQSTNASTGKISLNSKKSLLQKLSVFEIYTQAAYLKLDMLMDECILNGLDLSGDDRQYRDVDSVELIEATPRSTLTQS